VRGNEHFGEKGGQNRRREVVVVLGKRTDAQTTTEVKGQSQGHVHEAEGGRGLLGGDGVWNGERGCEGTVVIS